MRASYRVLSLLISLISLISLSSTYAITKKSSVATRSDSGSDILIASDKKLIPEVCSYELSLDTIKKGDNENTQLFSGFKGGNDRNVMSVKEPKRMAGSAHLRKGGVIWSYYTTNHRLTKMAYQAVFMGTLLNYGDIMATELSTDYNVIKMNTIQNKSTAAEEYLLTLTPKPDHEGYGKIIITIDKKSLLPIHRRYYALSGILLKECQFKKIEYQEGKLKYMEMDFFEPLKDRKTTVKFSNIEIKSAKDIPDRYFNENFLKEFGK